MIGIIVLLVISWGLLYLFENKSLLALGVLPVPQRLLQFVKAFFFNVLLCVLAQIMETWMSGRQWTVNERVDFSMIASGFWWDFVSVLTEELIFRGAVLYILIHRLGKQKGIIISAIAFGIYHWFSYGVFGNIMPMIFIFIGTGLMGYALAVAFANSRSILLPLGFHLGWNFTYNSVFSKGPLGDLLLISEGGTPLTGWISLINFLLPMILVPLLILAYIGIFVKKKAKNEIQE